MRVTKNVTMRVTKGSKINHFGHHILNFEVDHNNVLENCQLSFKWHPYPSL